MRAEPTIVAASEATVTVTRTHRRDCVCGGPPATRRPGPGNFNLKIRCPGHWQSESRCHLQWF